MAVIAVWTGATAALWRGNRKYWELSRADLITVSLFVLIGATLVALALTGAPSASQEGLS